MVSLRKALLQTSVTFMANMNSLDDPENWIRGRTADATHMLLPRSLEHPDRMNNTATVTMLGTLLPGLRDFVVTQIGDDGLVIDEARRTIMIHAEGHGMTDLGPYANEYIFTLFATQDGTQVRDSWEFVDSFLAKEFEEKLNQTSV
jgi:hypothetical protein